MLLNKQIIEAVDKLEFVVGKLQQAIKGGPGSGRYPAGSGDEEESGGGNGGKPKEETSKGDSKIPVIDKEQRKKFLDNVLNPPGGKLEIDAKYKKAFLADGDVEKFVASMQKVGGANGFISALRAESDYAELHGGIDVAKSMSLRNVRDKSIDVAKNLSPKQIESIQQYTTDDYANVNRALRREGKLSKNGKEMVEAVTAGVDAVGKWKEPATIYHGVASSSKKSREAFLANAEKALKSGGIWEEKAILSTSAGRKMAEDWIKKSSEGGVLMRIKANQGMLISTFTGLPSQQEVLQKPGSKYKVTGISEEVGARGQTVKIVDFEQV